MAKLSPSSPEENRTLTPVRSASMNVSSKAVLVAASVNRSPRVSPHESLTTDAPLVTAVETAASRLWSKQSWAPTNKMSAPGAIECTDSTSSACSGYQPLPSQVASWSTVAGSSLKNWPEESGLEGSFFWKYSCVSDSRVGESYASTIATPTLVPLSP